MPELPERTICNVHEMKLTSLISISWDTVSWSASSSCDKRYALFSRFYLRLVITRG